MGTQLNTGNRSAAPPAIKLQNVGDEVRFAVVDISLDLPMTEYGTNKPLVNANGKQKTQHALTVLVTDPGNAKVSDGDGGYLPAEADELHTIYISGYTKYDPDRDKTTAPWKSWGGITDDAGLEVGYIGAWKFLEEIPGKGTQPRKDRKFQLRAPKPEEQAIAQRCEELHNERQAAGTALPTDGSYGDEEPF